MNEDLNIIMEKLKECTINYPLNQIVGELNLAIERLGFADFESADRSVEKDLSTIEFLISHDVSSGVADFINFLVKTGKLGILLNDSGLMFVSFCQSYFNDMKQVFFRTAVELSPVAQQHVRMSLMRIYAVNTRVLFEVDQSIVAGFTLHDSAGLVCNYGMRSRVVKLIEVNLRKRLPFPWKQTVIR